MNGEKVNVLAEIFNGIFEKNSNSGLDKYAKTPQLASARQNNIKKRSKWTKGLSTISVYFVVRTRLLTNNIVIKERIPTIV